MYRITIEKSISSAHCLRQYEGKCRELHGHNWNFQVTIEADQLDSLGMVLDFGVVKRHLADLLEPFDHKLLNDVPPFDRLNPTAENISSFVFDELSKRLNTDRVKVMSVKTWETPTNVAEYHR
ncbi:MAG TPA: 6-carboxytetrahydropterin synthase QueD [Candidatus Ozemobacteraceae bacterium]|nr:6-carboxytetrahydropterin synthase QueD [Candidatus Ozemobacteraceae bacterium]